MSIRDSKRIRTIGRILFVLYIAFIIYFLIISDWYGRGGRMSEFRYNVEFFKEIKRFVVYRKQLGIFAVFTNLIGNVLIFVPFGFFMPMASRYKKLLDVTCYSFGFSLCVETFQFFSRVGIFDVDDLFLNTVGGIVGYLIYALCVTIRRKYVIQKKEKDRGTTGERTC